MYMCVCSLVSRDAEAMLYHAHQSSVYNGGKMRQAETRAHQSSGFHIVFCLAHRVNEQRR